MLLLRQRVQQLHVQPIRHRHSLSNRYELICPLSPYSADCIDRHHTPHRRSHPPPSSSVATSWGSSTASLCSSHDSLAITDFFYPFINRSTAGSINVWISSVLNEFNADFTLKKTKKKLFSYSSCFLFFIDTWIAASVLLLLLVPGWMGELNLITVWYGAQWLYAGPEWST